MAGRAVAVEAVVISSDEEDDDEKVISKPIAAKNIDLNSRNTDDNFVILLSLFAKRLKDEAVLKRLCHLHNVTPASFTSSVQFKKFLRQSCTKLRETNSTETSLMLMTSVCQTLALREVQIVPENKNSEPEANVVGSVTPQQKKSKPTDISPTTVNKSNQSKNISRLHAKNKNDQHQPSFSSKLKKPSSSSITDGTLQTTNIKKNIPSDSTVQKASQNHLISREPSHSIVQKILQSQSKPCLPCDKPAKNPPQGHALPQTLPEQNDITEKPVSKSGTQTEKDELLLPIEKQNQKHVQADETIKSMEDNQTSNSECLKITDNSKTTVSKANSSANKSSKSNIPSSILNLNPRVVLNFDPKRIEDIAKKLREKHLLDDKGKSDKLSQKNIKNDQKPGSDQASDEVVKDKTENEKQLLHKNDTFKDDTTTTFTGSVSSLGSNDPKLEKLLENHQNVQNTPLIVIDCDNDTEPITKSSPKDSAISKDNTNEKKQFSKKMKIKILERNMKQLESQIMQYTQQELSLHDMESEDSAYLNEAKVKEKYVQTWRKYCKLTGEDADELVATQKKIKVKSSPFPELNREVSKYVNRTGSFPNLFDIKQVCLKVNDNCDLSLKPNDLHNCAVDVFTEVGRKLQKNREKEFRATAGNQLTDQVKLEDDPAISDDNLKRKLKQNRKLAKQRTDEVFTDFVRQQYEQEAGGESQVSESEEDEHLEQLRKNNLISNKKVKRQVINKNANVKSKPKKRPKEELSPDSDENQKCKKTRNEKTVISVTVSSSQEDETKTNQKLDYRVTIDSPIPNVSTAKSSKTNPSASTSKSPELSNTGSHTITARSSPSRCTTQTSNKPLTPISKNSKQKLLLPDHISPVKSPNSSKVLSPSSHGVSVKNNGSVRKGDFKLKGNFKIKPNKLISMRKAALGLLSDDSKQTSARYRSPLKQFRSLNNNETKKRQLPDSTKITKHECKPEVTMTEIKQHDNNDDDDAVILISDEED